MLTVAQIEVELHANECGRLLKTRSTIFKHDGSVPPRWFLAGAKPDSRSRATDRAPLRWQAEAIQAWRESGCRGVVEAVTGTGKTHVGILAAAAELNDGGCVLVLVPSLALCQQWVDELRTSLPGTRVERRDGSNSASLSGHDRQIVVSTVHSALRGSAGLPTNGGLLIADECHRYGAQVFATALHDRFDRRLGLTATFERNDEGIDDYLTPYFGEVCFSLDYERALADQIVAPWSVATLGVDFLETERSQYLKAEETLKEARTVLVQHCGVPEEPFGEFMRGVGELAEQQVQDPCTRRARDFLKAFSARQDLLANAAGKIQIIGHLAPSIQHSSGTLLFCERIDTSQAAAAELVRCGVVARALDGSVDAPARTAVLDTFRSGAVQAIAAPKVLDEGVDLPNADLGVVVAASSSKRQMIQRMGRVIRRKSDGGAARFVILYVRGTIEDPQFDRHSGFLDMMMPHAMRHEDFDGSDPGGLTEFLTPVPLPDAPPRAIDTDFRNTSNGNRTLVPTTVHTYADGCHFPPRVETYEPSRIGALRPREFAPRLNANALKRTEDDVRSHFPVNAWHSVVRVRAFLMFRDTKELQTELERLRLIYRRAEAPADRKDTDKMLGSEVVALWRWLTQ